MKKLLTTAGLVIALSTASFAAQNAGNVNGMNITVDEANQALKVLTKGKMTWDKLPKEGRNQLIHMMAPSKLVASASKKELSAKEQEAALSGFWMQKKMSKITISDKEAKTTYDKMVKAAKAANSKEKIPAFEKVKNNIKMQMAQEKVVNGLMKNAKITVN
ncbi:MAG: hypothetical protein IE885_00550 [Campylobacterales bacterium]|nr:hypothetical protein [Campylobacterales bacterium]